MSTNVIEYTPAAHYDHVHQAWLLIMGDEFHYGYFALPNTSLPEATAALTRQMMARADLSAGDRVLDVGCGTGRQSCDLAAEFGCRILGITTSAAGVTAASALAVSRGLVSARFERRDGTDNGLRSSHFDVVWVLESSHLMRDRQALLGECARVLAPGGRLVLCDIMRRRPIPFLEVRQRRQDFSTLRSAFGDAHMEPLAQYAGWLEGVGLTVTDATDISRQTVPTFSAWRQNCATHEVALRQLIGQQGVEDFVRATEILEAFWLDGTLGYGILSATKPARNASPAAQPAFPPRAAAR